MKNIIKYFICSCSVIFTILSMVVVCISIAIANENTVVVPQRYLHLFVFSFILSLGNTFKKATQLSITVSMILHGVCYIGGFLVFLIISEISTPAIIAFTALFALVYFTVLVISAFKNRKKDVRNSVKMTVNTKTSRNKVPTKNKSNNAKTKDNEYTNLFS